MACFLWVFGLEIAGNVRNSSIETTELSRERQLVGSLDGPPVGETIKNIMNTIK